jgi:hypothetical protein
MSAELIRKVAGQLTRVQASLERGRSSPDACSWDPEIYRVHWPSAQAGDSIVSRDSRIADLGSVCTMVEKPRNSTSLARWHPQRENGLAWLWMKTVKLPGSRCGQNHYQVWIKNVTDGWTSSHWYIGPTLTATPLARPAQQCWGTSLQAHSSLYLLFELNSSGVCGLLKTKMKIG